MNDGGKLKREARATKEDAAATVICTPAATARRRLIRELFYGRWILSSGSQSTTVDTSSFRVSRFYPRRARRARASLREIRARLLNGTLR